jgi:ABC-type lipoprotein export system ATPase subunit
LDSKSTRAVISAFEQAKSALDATIFMVTHDSYAASFCDRVIILKDGLVWRTMTHNHEGDEMQDRLKFQDRLLDAIREMGKE